jgi:hypothetical protein
MQIKAGLLAGLLGGVPWEVGAAVCGRYGVHSCAASGWGSNGEWCCLCTCHIQLLVSCRTAVQASHLVLH